jgi:hypothetical protein
MRTLALGQCAVLSTLWDAPSAIGLTSTPRRRRQSNERNDRRTSARCLLDGRSANPDSRNGVPAVNCQLIWHVDRPSRSFCQPGWRSTVSRAREALGRTRLLGGPLGRGARGAVLGRLLVG